MLGLLIFHDDIEMKSSRSRSSGVSRGLGGDSINILIAGDPPTQGVDLRPAPESVTDHDLVLQAHHRRQRPRPNFLPALFPLQGTSRMA